jgi:hypothetical protein
LVANTITGNSGTINVNGGAGAPGRIRVEAYTLSGAINFTQPPSITTPGSVTLASNPTLTIYSVAGVATPPSPGGNFATPDVTLPNTTGTSVPVVVNAANVPAGTSVTLRVTLYSGTLTPTNSFSGTLNGSPPSATITATIPVDQPFALDAEATFTLTARLENDSPIKYAGEDVTTVTVTASLGGRSQARYFTASGREVPGGALVALGLPR